MGFNDLILKLKRAESPPALLLKRGITFLRTPSVPRWPRFFLPMFRFFYEAVFVMIGLWRVFLNKLIWGALFQARCTAFGKAVEIHGLPYVNGHTEIHLGNNVYIGGNVSIHSGRIVEKPRLLVKDGASIGWNVSMVANREILIEEDAIVSYDCRISDSDGHPREMDLRTMKQPPRVEDVRPVRICRGAWICNGVHIMKGVTVGEGAVVAANSVVIMDVPAFSLAMGNPAEVYFRNYGLPSTHPLKQHSKQKSGKMPGSRPPIATPALVPPTKMEAEA